MAKTNFRLGVGGSGLQAKRHNGRNECCFEQFHSELQVNHLLFLAMSPPLPGHPMAPAKGVT
jgi:hypothetical protein